MNILRFFKNILYFKTCATTASYMVNLIFKPRYWSRPSVADYLILDTKWHAAIFGTSENSIANCVMEVSTLQNQNSHFIIIIISTEQSKTDYFPCHLYPRISAANPVTACLCTSCCCVPLYNIWQRPAVPYINPCMSSGPLSTFKPGSFTTLWMSGFIFMFPRSFFILT